ncbi:unnamed protein product [Linum trigynum]|uniref:Uncharacterized protein n=1 Tax=Linum trigynum TaxID=586398 RepID=A0AAV2D305_9ROSI
MELQVVVETTSTTYIKPSSPTPPHLQIYNISGMDQINPQIYGPVILFYPPPPQPDHRRSSLLKQSLSDTLSRYFPLAGKFRHDGLSIDCSAAAAGAYYAEARIVNKNTSLFQFLAELNLAAIKHLFPLSAVENNNILSPPPPGSPVILLQVTWFPCGGASIALLVAHNVLDASSIGCFLRAWGGAAAALIRNQPPLAGGGDGGSGIWDPKFGGDSIFPRNEMRSPSPAAVTAAEQRNSPAVTRRFVFNAAGLASLKEKLKEPMISRVLAVTAILCESILRAITASRAPPSAVVVTQAVNLRRKGYPPFPTNSFGNYVINAVATIDPREIEDPSCCLVKLLMDSVAKRSGGGFVSKIQGRAGAALLAEAAADEYRAGRRRIGFTSWSRLGLYDADFGWGEPAWLGLLPSDQADDGGGGVMDLVMILDTKDGSGLEAWVFLEGNEMGMLENDEKLLSFACLDPRPRFIPDSTVRSRL